MDKKTRSCIVFTPASEALRGVCGFYRIALETTGLDVRLINPRTTSSIISDLTKAIDESLLFFLSFEGDCTALTTHDGKNFFNLIRRPIITLCDGDPPVIAAAPQVIFGLRNKFKTSGSCYFAPHPGLCIDGEDMKRDIDAAFCYELKNPDSFREQWHADSGMAQICEDVLDILLTEERVTARQAFDTTMEGHGIYLENWKPVEHAFSPIYARSSWDFKTECIRLVDGFMENRRRSLLFDTLTKSGINVTSISSPSFDEYLQILRRSKIVLSAGATLEYSLPWHMSCGIASGAVAAADGNAFIDEAFADDDYIPYSHNSYEMLADRIKEMIHSPSRLASASESGRQVIEANYTPAHAVEKLILAADYSKLLHG